ncbi:MAG: DUF1080 domain-containing protein [Erysipelotrichales bacterium]|nr:DUF1080 domain-containing protein [Erysipelotrichales bacterium]
MKRNLKLIALFSLAFSVFLGVKNNNAKATNVKADSKSYIVDSFNDVPADWELYKRADQGTQAEAKDGQLVITNSNGSAGNYYGGVYLFDTEAYTNFTFKMEFSIQSSANTRRFIGLLWHTNIVNDYLNGLYMNYRMDGGSAASVIHHSGSFTDDSEIKAGTPALKTNEYHTLKVVMNGDYVYQCIDDILITSYDVKAKYASNLLGPDYPRSGGFGVLVNNCALKIKSISIFDEVERNSDGGTSTDHLMALFNNYNGAMAKCIPASWSTIPYVIDGADSTSAVGLKGSAGIYRDTAGKADYLEFGQYDETSNWPTAEKMSLKNYKDVDEELYKVYADLQDTLQDYRFVSALITTSYIEDVQDISLYWGNSSSGLYGNAYLYFVYQLEDGDGSWHILTRDDGVSTYSTSSIYGGVGADGDYAWNNYAIFSGDVNGANETTDDGDFALNLKGKTAKIGVVLASLRGPNNKIDLTGFMVNRVNSIKAVMNDASLNESTLVEMGGYNILQSQADKLDSEIASNGSYFDDFSKRYEEITGNKLSKETVRTFLEDWDKMRANGEGGICDYIKDPNWNMLKDLLARYDAFDEAHKEEINNTIDKGSGGFDSEDTTIGNTIQFAKAELEAYENESSDQNDPSLGGLIILSKNNTASIIALFIILGLVAVSAYYLIEKKKFAK